jgi:hypothetical protein
MALASRLIAFLSYRRLVNQPIAIATTSPPITEQTATTQKINKDRPRLVGAEVVGSSLGIVGDSYGFWSMPVF